MINMNSIEREVLEEFESVLKERSSLDPNFLDNELIDDIVMQMRESLEERNELFAILKLESAVHKPTYQSLVIQNASSEESKNAQIKSQDKIELNMNIEQKLQVKSIHYLSQRKKIEKQHLDEQSNEENAEISQNASRLNEVWPVLEKKQRTCQDLEGQRKSEQKAKKYLQRKKLEQQWQREYQAQCQLTDRARYVARRGATVHITGIYNQKTKRFDKKKDIQHLSLNSVIIKTEKGEFLINKLKGVFTRGTKENLLQIGQSLLKKEEEREISQEEKMLLLSEMDNY